MDARVSLPTSRARLAWGGFLLLIGLVLVLFVAAFVGTFVLGLFVYYGVRPLHRRLHARVERRQLSAALTVLFVVVPLLALVGAGLLVAARELAVIVGPEAADAILARLPGEPQSLQTLLQSPGSIVRGLERTGRLRPVLRAGVETLGQVATGALHLTLSLAFAFFLLRDGPRLAAWFHEDVAGPESVAGAYLAAVDADLETVYFGNVLTVLAVGATGIAVYHGFNLIAPPGLTVPSPTLLALLTGLATFVPLVVGKLVYVPVAGYLAWRATVVEANVGLLGWIGGFLVVSFLALDFVPQTLVRPLVAGRSLHGGLVLFAYVLGGVLFGWYGLFLGPFLLVLVVQAANLLLPELLHGDRLTGEAHTVIGTDPDEPTESTATTGGAGDDAPPSGTGTDGDEQGPAGQ